MRIIIETDAPGATAQVVAAPAAEEAHDGGPVPTELMWMTELPGTGTGSGAADGSGGTTAASQAHDGGPPQDALLQRALGSLPPGRFTG